MTRTIADDQRVSLDPYRHQFRIYVDVGEDTEAVASAAHADLAFAWCTWAARAFDSVVVNTVTGAVCRAREATR